MDVVIDLSDKDRLDRYNKILEPKGLHVISIDDVNIQSLPIFKSGMNDRIFIELEPLWKILCAFRKMIAENTGLHSRFDVRELSILSDAIDIVKDQVFYTVENPHAIETKHN